MSRVIYLGITRHEGIAKASGKPYSIQQVHYATDPQARKDLNFSAGLEPQSQQVTDDAAAKFARLPILTEVELHWTPIPNNPQRNEIGGFKTIAAAQSA